MPSLRRSVKSSSSTSRGPNSSCVTSVNDDTRLCPSPFSDTGMLRPVTWRSGMLSSVVASSMEFVGKSTLRKLWESRRRGNVLIQTLVMGPISMMESFRNSLWHTHFVSRCDYQSPMGSAEVCISLNPTPH